MHQPSRGTCPGNPEIRWFESSISDSYAQVPGTSYGNPFTPLLTPLIARAPSLRFALNRSRARANASFKNSLLPITQPLRLHPLAHDLTTNRHKVKVRQPIFEFSKELFSAGAGGGKMYSDFNGRPTGLPE